MSACAVVTGAAGALGGAVSKELAASGMALALVDSPRHADRLATFAKSLGGDARPFAVDLAAEGAWPALVEDIEATMGAVGAAALVAGGYQSSGPFWESDDAVWHAMMTGNLDTAARGLKSLLSVMVPRKAGSIVVIGSRNVERPWTGAGSSAYTASKAALVALAQAVAAEAMPHGVRINAVLPSTLDTPANRAAMPKADPSTWVALDAAAKSITFLLSEGARDISGAALPLYGRA